MSKPTRIISLLFVVSLASACWSRGETRLGRIGANAQTYAPLQTVEPVSSAMAQLMREPPQRAVRAEPVRVDPSRAASPEPAAGRRPQGKRRTADRGDGPERPPSRPVAKRVDRCAKGTFFDPRGECWSCPKGYHRTIFPVTASNACERRVRIRHATVAGKRNATGIFKTNCTRGYFLHRLSGVCYKCPKGYRRTIFAIDGRTACEKWEGPHWTKAKLHKKLTCGNDGNRACTILERVPSCDAGLKEDRRAVCVPLAPGENPFLAGVGEKGKALADLGVQACRKMMQTVPSLPGKDVVSMSLECRRRAMAGFACEIPAMIDQVSQLTDYAARFSRAWESKPCSEWATPARPLCATVSATLGDTPQVLACVGAALQAGVFGQLDRGEVCEASGQIAFQIAMRRNVGKSTANKKESRLDRLKKMLVRTGKAADGMADLSQQLDRLAECRILDDVR